MPHLPVLLPNDAPPEVRKVYEDFCGRMLFPSAPNFIMTQGHSPTVARGTWDVVRNVLVSGQVPRWTKEMIFAAISKDRDCHYCAAAHIACCRMLGVDHKVLESLVTDVNSIEDPKLRDTIIFAVKCSRDPGDLLESDFQKLRSHGLKQSEIMEIIGMSALAVYANIIADATGMEPDAMFDELTSTTPS